MLLFNSKFWTRAEPFGSLARNDSIPLMFEPRNPNRKLRIAVWHNLPSGGGKRALYNHVKGLVERGHYVESWCPPTADQTYLPLREFCPEHVVPLSDAKPLPWLQQFRSLLDYKEMASRISAMDQHCRKCAVEIAQGEFDILFANACMFFRVTPIAKYVTIPSALYLGEPYRWLYEALPTLPWALPRSRHSKWSLSHWREFIRDSVHIRGLRLQVREECENAAAFDSILVNSLYSRESVLRAYGVDAQVCYLGIDSDKFKPTGEQPESFIMGFGGLSHAKGPDRAIRAIGKVAASKRPEFVWVGNFSSQDYERELQHLAMENGVRFTVKVRVSDAELVSLLSRAAMLLYTSRLEPFGLAPLEANACGAPVVAIAEGGVRESIQHEQNGLLVKGDNPEELARAIERLLDDKALAADLRKKSVQYVNENWHLTNATDRIEATFLNLVSQKLLNSWQALTLTPRVPNSQTMKTRIARLKPNHALP